MSTDKIIIIGGGIITVVLIIGISLLLTKDASNSASIPDEQIVARNGLHWHPKLSIIIEGKKQEFPGNIGIAGQIHQKIHTHDTDSKDGIVHIEAQGMVTKDDTKLGNFFKIWGKEFSSNKIFDKTNGPEGKVKMKVNGTENLKFENYQMKDGDNIEIIYE